jgi:hypothetical protein
MVDLAMTMLVLVPVIDMTGVCGAFSKATSETVKLDHGGTHNFVTGTILYCSDRVRAIRLRVRASTDYPTPYLTITLMSLVGLALHTRCMWLAASGYESCSSTSGHRRPSGWLGFFLRH